MKNKYFRQLKKMKPKEIQTTIMLAFSIVSISIMLILGVILYLRFSNSAREETINGTQKLMEQTGESMEAYLMSMRQISDTVYYNVIKENDFENSKQEIQSGMNLLYEANKENLRSIALYNDYGSLITAEPVVAQKEDPDVTGQEWYLKATEEMENMHFSTPHIQNLFNDTAKSYYWVISLSRVVELTNQGIPQSGVLLVDMDFSSISRMMKQINEVNNGQYYYLCDSNGEIIYHPRQIQISDGIYDENNIQAAVYKDGVYNESFKGENRKVVVNTISYTGWKLVGVIPYSTFNHGMVNIRYFVAMLIILMTMMLVVINRVVSLRISSPILKLNHSVREYEAGEKPEIYIGGSQEIRHLGYSIQKSYEQIDDLMKKIVLEQNERRKSELDALQSQIHPHFLYNTLESITWMVEAQENEAAVRMISELAKLLRVSLSRGKTIIPIKDELQHSRSYMNIQLARYKERFKTEFRIDKEIENYCIVKLVIQPILENAIYYGVGNMDEDDDGMIIVTGEKRDGDILITIEDNGMGMREEVLENILTDSSKVPKHGSGVGVINVHSRIRLMFGEEYGLFIESEPDEGTKVTIRIPAIPYTPENAETLELQKYIQRRQADEKE